MTDGDGAERTVDSGSGDPDPETGPGSNGATTSVGDVVEGGEDDQLSGYNYAYLDEHTKREVRRAVLAAIAIPGYQVPFASREMPLARGWGTGGLQVTLSTLRPDDTLKVIDQGSDRSVNAANIRRLATRTANVDTTTDATAASVVQTRHRIPEEPLAGDQILVLQVPTPDPLQRVDPRESENRRRHAHAIYDEMWVTLYEHVAEHGEANLSTRYPVMVADRYLMDPSPIPRWDVPKLDGARHLSVFAAGRAARIYAVPPYTSVEPLAFEDRPFRVEQFPEPCHYCGSTDTFRSEVETDDGDRLFVCNDTSFCAKRLADPSLPRDHHLDESVSANGGGDSV